MDPLTTAIVAAITAGVASGMSEVSKQAVVDTYGTLKATLKEKFGDDSDLIEAVDKLEQKPESAGWKEEVQTQIQATQAAEDDDLKRLAQALLESLQSAPEGQQASSKYRIDAHDSQIGVIGDEAKIEGGMHFDSGQ